MTELLEKIRNLNFTDVTAVKNCLADIVHTICDEVQGTPREITPVETSLATRAINLNLFDHDQVKHLLSDIVRELSALEASPLKPHETLDPDTEG